MEWVETVAKSVEAAKSAALDRLGVAEDEAEFEVVSTPKPGLFGRVRGEARVRARVKPASVRPKTERRRRANKGRGEEGESSNGRRKGQASKKGGRSSSNNGGGAPSETDVDAPAGGDSREDTPRPSRRRRRGGANGEATTSKNETMHDEAGAQDAADSATRPARSRRKETTMSAQESESGRNGESASPVTPDEVAQAAVSFLEDLAGALGSSATGTATVEGTDIEVQLAGDDLGLLIGPAGGTLQAIQDLTRVVAQRKLGDHETRLRVDIAGYRERRRGALEKFARAVSEQVVESQRPRALEPMSSADRKVIHDVVQTIDGVASTSDGSDPNRRVVITPAESAD